MAEAEKTGPTLKTIFREFFLMGSVSFGGGMFSLIYERLVQQQHWVSEEEFKECITCSEIAPGPFTLHIVMYLGYHLRGLLGLCLATLAFCLPSLLVVSGIAFFNRFFLRDIPGMAGFISGVWAAIFAFMGSTVFSLTKKTLRDPFLIAISAVSIGLILVFKLNFLFIILLGGSTFVAVHFFRTLPTFNPKAALAEPGEPT